MCKFGILRSFLTFHKLFDRCFQKLPTGHMKNGYVKTLFFLWHLVRIRGCPFQKVSHDLIELCGVLRGNDRRNGL